MKIKIGSSTYDIIDNEDLLRTRDYMGEIYYHEKTIELQTGYPKETRQQTLIHEIVHGILKEMEEHELNRNEQFVELLSKQLFMLINENNLIEIFNNL